MTNQLIKLCMALGLLLAVSNANAEWSGNLTVSHIYGGENITIYFNEATPNPAGCSQGPLKVASWEGSTSGADNLMAMMLAAKMSGRSVQVHMDSQTCLWGGWPKMTVMKLL